MPETLHLYHRRSPGGEEFRLYRDRGDADAMLAGRKLLGEPPERLYGAEVISLEVIERQVDPAVEAGRIARMTESELHPSFCIAHRERVRWIPAPGWWIHARDLRTCMPMWNANAPEPHAR